MAEIRCEEHRLFGVVSEKATGIFEATCNSRWCNPNNSSVTLHIWDLEKISENGIILPIDTKRLKRPK